jgi:hypothetical protein
MDRPRAGEPGHRLGYPRSRKGTTMIQRSRPLFLPLVGALLAALLAAPDTVAAPQGDAVAGSGTLAPFGSTVPGPDTPKNAEFTVSARSGPNGEDPSGVIRYRIPGWTVAAADVTCLWTSGDRAVGGGVVRTGEIPAGFNILLLAVEDNGQPGRGHDLATTYISPSSEDPVTICADRGESGAAFIALQWLTRGNLTVRDN